MPQAELDVATREEAIEVHAADPPVLTASAAVVLLRILVKAANDAVLPHHEPVTS